MLFLKSIKMYTVTSSNTHIIGPQKAQKTTFFCKKRVDWRKAEKKQEKTVYKNKSKKWLISNI